MTDRLFRSMTPDRDSMRDGVSNGVRADMAFPVTLVHDPGDSVRCPRCGTLYYAGDWPWCGDEGPEGHKR